MISIVICSITPAKLSAVKSNLSSLLGDEAHEFVAIHDAKSLAEGYNRGVAKSRGEILILCHDDIEILAKDFRERLLFRLRHYDLLGVAGSRRLAGPQWVSAGPPHIFGQVAHVDRADNSYDVYVWSAPAPCVGGIRVMDGLFLAGQREVFEQVPFDDATFDGFHLYDVDFTFRAAKAGFELAVCLDLMVIHASSGHFDERWRQYAERFVRKHHGQFASDPPHGWQGMRVKVASKERLPEILRSPDWRDWRETG
jgi:GT2 family glycosyltransferase